MWKIFAVCISLICVGCGEEANGAFDGVGDGLARSAQQYNQSRMVSVPVYTSCRRVGNMVNCTSF